jgi:hypothetical protein
MSGGIREEWHPLRGARQPAPEVRVMFKINCKAVIPPSMLITDVEEPHASQHKPKERAAHTPDDSNPDKENDQGEDNHKTGQTKRVHVAVKPRSSVEKTDEPHNDAPAVAGPAEDSDTDAGKRRETGSGAREGADGDKRREEKMASRDPVALIMEVSVCICVWACVCLCIHTCVRE